MKGSSNFQRYKEACAVYKPPHGKWRMKIDIVLVTWCVLDHDILLLKVTFLLQLAELLKSIETAFRKEQNFKRLTTMPISVFNQAWQKTNMPKSRKLPFFLTLQSVLDIQTDATSKVSFFFFTSKFIIDSCTLFNTAPTHFHFYRCT